MWESLQNVGRFLGFFELKQNFREENLYYRIDLGKDNLILTTLVEIWLQKLLAYSKKLTNNQIRSDWSKKSPRNWFVPPFKSHPNNKW